MSRDLFEKKKKLPDTFEVLPLVTRLGDGFDYMLDVGNLFVLVV